MSKKNAWLVFEISLALCLWLLLIYFCMSSCTVDETLLQRTQSPDGEYTLEAYRINPHATADFSVRVYLIENGDRELIYDVYHEEEAELVWISDSVICINGNKLDLAIGETYEYP